MSTVELATPTDANKKIGEGDAIMYLKSGQEYEVREMNVMMDSTKCVDKMTKQTVMFPTDEIQSIKMTHHGGGALEGLLFGGLGGSALGLVLGLGMGTGGDEGMGRGLLVFTGLATGTVGGFMFGIIKGHEYTFVFPDDSVTVKEKSSIEK